MEAVEEDVEAVIRDASIQCERRHPAIRRRCWKAFRTQPSIHNSSKIHA
jgi:hypothetical protein